MRSRYRFYETKSPYFVTCTILDWLPIFTEVSFFRIATNSLQYLREKKRLRLISYVIMENHLHMILSSENPSKDIASFKGFTARKIIDLLKERNKSHILDALRKGKSAHKHDREFQLWQEGSHPQLIKTPEMMLQKITYIHNNPLKRGYVDKPEHWVYSSARNYEEISPTALEIDLFTLC